MQIALGRDAFPHRQDRYRCVTRRQLTGYAMPWRQQASRPIQCRSCTGSMPLRGVLRRSRLPERNRHAGDLWRPNACLMTVWRQGEPASSRKRRAKGVSAIVLARDCSLGRTCVHCKPRNHGRTTRQRMSLRAATHSFGQCIHASMQNSSLAPRRRTGHLPINIHGRPLSEATEGRLGRKGAWGGREAGAEGRLGQKGAWGGTEAGAEGSMGRKGVWGARHIPTHHPPL